MAIYITPPLGEEVAENRPELAGVNAGVKVGYCPASDSAEPV